MQHIPYTSLEDIERNRQEMEAFRKERKVVHQEEKVIIAVKCKACGQMIVNLKLKEHPCL